MEEEKRGKRGAPAHKGQNAHTGSWACTLLRDITEGRMKSKASHGRKRLHMLSDLASSAKYPEMKRAAENRQRWRATNKKGMNINLLHSRILNDN